MKKIKAFTMLEILMITIIVGVGLLSIVVAISKAKTVTNQIKQEVIATQLAKEGIEMVYQTRNSNLLKHPNYKNYCRLNVNPNQSCNDSSESPDRLTVSSYIISDRLLSGINETLNILDGINTGEQRFGLILTGGKWLQNGDTEPKQTKYGKFFRIIEGKGLYQKNYNTHTGGIKITCGNRSHGGETQGLEYECKGTGEQYSNGPGAFEFRFCSRVEYIGQNTGSVEICGLITNFFED
ncbi:MAG TPA: type II secretion system protein [Candidatus Absconditabacterales bacterium]|nr:type II secretion system protein [Candidatus Absconditabacterales bacterium]